MRIKAYKIDYRFLSWADLSESEQRKFPELFDDIESRDLCRFIRDNNRIYEFDEFIQVPSDLETDFYPWSAYRPDSDYSGLLIRFVTNKQTHVNIARYQL